MMSRKDMERLNRLLFDSRMKLFSAMKVVEGARLSDLSPIANQLIDSDAWLSKQGLIDSASSSFGGKIREDAFFVRNSFERQFNTLFEIVWMLVYKDISERTSTGPYVSQIPNFEIRKQDGVRTVHMMGWCSLIWNGEVTRAGAILIHWLNEREELPGLAEPFLGMVQHLLPESFCNRWQQDLS